MHPIWYIKDFSFVNLLATLERLGVALLVILLAFTGIAFLAKRLTWVTPPEKSLDADAEENNRVAAAVASARHFHENTP